MGYDRIFVERSGHPERFLDEAQAYEMGLHGEFEDWYGRVYEKGHFAFALRF
jgi:hypothetical protein